MVHPLLMAAVHAVVGAVVLHFVRSIWREDQAFLDLAIASAGAALISLVPTIGGWLAPLVMLGLLYWRCTASTQILGAAVLTATFLKALALAALASFFLASR